MATRKTASLEPRQSWATLNSVTSSAKAKVAALQALGWSIADSRAKYAVVLALVTDREQTPAVRAAALAAAQSVTFDAQRFAALRPDYLRALRSVSDDPDLELRQRALGMLMREGDPPTQQRLLEGLTDPTQALLPPEKVLQLLAYDVHAEAYVAARKIAANPPNPDAKREALRLLAADSSAVPVFEDILKNRQEPSELRRLSASALHQLAPNRFQALAREIAMSAEGEDEDLRTSCLVALAQFGNVDAMRGDSALQQQVERLNVTARANSELGNAAQQFIGRYKP